jgi:hypothetical protein
MKTKIIILCLFVLSFLLSACTGVPIEKQCTQDIDCIQAQCCHATDVVNKDNRPDCTGILCSAECAPNTMDCGQAKAKCIENACTLVFQE